MLSWRSIRNLKPTGKLCTNSCKPKWVLLSAPPRVRPVALYLSKFGVCHSSVNQIDLNKHQKLLLPYAEGILSHLRKFLSDYDFIFITVIKPRGQQPHPNARLSRLSRAGGAHCSSVTYRLPRNLEILTYFWCLLHTLEAVLWDEWRRRLEIWMLCCFLQTRGLRV